ncbi:MmgE/PrpD family protein [Cupriavidus oxalaticus]|uniref:MmgE/PrpD family protein n=1 Tax=Cupriavidus oxalaticus TaxID=96344 RepID=A0A4P7LJ57_9BURK|nr:MmgE/PrpD family protein [Cupriavidus oxalaticus]QBY56264.1 MmgE/PrpD family protein [Cupriavidus oxalaticus]
MTQNLSIPSGITARAASFTVERTLRFPPEALALARLSIYDCLSVASAGAQEPVSRAVRELVRTEAGAPQASAFGLAQRVPARAAALLNGAVAHALDYDDTHFDFVGHPSVTVLPAALAVAEQQQACGKALLESFLIGVEITCRVGAWLGRSHYNAGFHQTATSGAFGATAVAARLLNLDGERASHAFGVAATRASGLKCQFGTMAKPFHAGMAASTGVEAANLAALGFVSRTDALTCVGGFADTHSGRQDATEDAFAGLPDTFHFARIQHKFHACCHGTHPALEALTAVRHKHLLQPDDIARIMLTVAPQWLSVCCIAQPATGLEAKFSLALTAAMTLAGLNTAALASFSDANCRNPTLVNLARRVEIIADPSMADTACHGAVVTKSGATLTAAVDVNRPLPYAIRAAKLRSKAKALLGAQRAEALWELIDTLEAQEAPVLYPRLHAWMAGGAA